MKVLFNGSFDLCTFDNQVENLNKAYPIWSRWAVFAFDSGSLMSAKCTWVNANYARLKETLLQIRKEVPGVYAISILFYCEDYSLRVPNVEVSYNTIENYQRQIPNAFSDMEAKWNYAFWQQHCKLIIGGKEDEQMQAWLSTSSYYYTKEEETLAYADTAEFNALLEKGDKLCNLFIDEIILMVRKLFEENFVRETFGKHIPVIIHELEYGNDSLLWTLRSNPSEVISEFTKVFHSNMT